ncbi:MAG TPA: preprotein translocase subunit YajC [Candidatus Syntrophosphaera sp.]|jgi:preprotein translocase subunit YajC|nr:preprotein translocase subunit YajC [Candidatus Cloacimonadota bacterium]HNU53518.1 preprotein translocase subunit YajC [Candidatus Syntrophosphaera sp.]HOH48324.1 preprotein translocase subunit YajC [Candidatus Syntrophosphaera sp.]HPW38175.1 preprotein translocase subunit YajC [Candidatus Syntrophosphaera sp.]HQC46562.1 preprotein translocase subunit YajC [Candidatus Syntrophosphaera sp.]
MLYTLLMTGAGGTSGTAPAQQTNPLMSLLPIIIMFALLYFLMIMPQQKKQKELQKMLDNIKVNDKVITTSGIYGRVVTIKPDKNSVVIEIDETNHVRVEFQRGAIATVVTGENSAAQS